MTTDRPGEDAVPSVEEQLEQILREAEARVAELRRRLEEHRREAAQHAEVDRLSEHLAAATVRWSEVRGFFDEVITELRAPDAAAPEPTSDPDAREH
ncbi:hypothetical protein [Isoptericola variabilis]|uniref:Uncharacterized protein n=1 Tax=Isoptericola variabilis (strain 225) TaxID=743718 RepID=F6FX92_ISOV2|nr:hypothetical protein [Isoptericola variabilis]AEG43595.1 hypothetical protein Isova_0809 [Isoptericola variabilis 225]TWH32037.1 hypothetical protein L600_000200000610 [Isoptericola variabilis J7]